MMQMCFRKKNYWLTYVLNFIYVITLMLFHCLHKSLYLKQCFLFYHQLNTFTVWYG